MFEKILVADDDVDVRGRFYEILSSLGYGVTCVPTGKEALLRLTEERPSLIILDRDMPGLGGIDTAKKIREFDKGVKIIILFDREVEKEAEEIVKDLNLQGIIKKDFSTPDMMQQIRSVLEEGEQSGLKEDLLEKSKGSIFILIVDDNQEIREVLGSFLAKKGYKALKVSSGEEALMKIKTEIEKPQIVLLDIRMPGLDGLATLKEIKNLDDSIKIVMLTSAQDEYIMEEAARLGASAYLLKPCDLDNLDRLITSIVFQKKE
ncbi:MAG: response regulator [Candidatus Omnitrophica bacterium]|nr:response regulator [Candidatus Omnitrophota bacterium]